MTKIYLTTTEAAQKAYEADLLKAPRYPDGGMRPSWEDLRPSLRELWANGLLPVTKIPLARTISEIKIGDRVRFVTDGTLGEVEDVDGACVKVRWDHGAYSIFHKRDGFTLFVPIPRDAV